MSNGLYQQQQQIMAVYEIEVVVIIKKTKITTKTTMTIAIHKIDRLLHTDFFYRYSWRMTAQTTKKKYGNHFSWSNDNSFEILNL